MKKYNILKTADELFAPLPLQGGGGGNCCFILLPFGAFSQDKVVNPTSRQLSRTLREIGGQPFEGVEGYEDYVLTNLSGLTVGQQIEVPGQEITEAVKRYWRHGLFSLAIQMQQLAGGLKDSPLYPPMALRHVSASQLHRPEEVGARRRGRPSSAS